MSATADGSTGPAEALARDLTAIGVAAEPAFVERALAFARLLEKWNAKIRLVGPSALDVIVREQIVDACGFVHALAALPEASAWWDVGAGGGLPGILLALRFPERRVVMVEPIHKKTSFLQHAAQVLGLANAIVHTGRVETDGRVVPAIEPRALRGGVPTAALSRATLAPEAWLGTARRLVGAGGVVVIAAADALPAAVTDDPASSALGTWRWTVPATGAPRILHARRMA